MTNGAQARNQQKQARRFGSFRKQQRRHFGPQSAVWLQARGIYQLISSCEADTNREVMRCYSALLKALGQRLLPPGKRQYALNLAQGRPEVEEIAGLLATLASHTGDNVGMSTGASLAAACSSDPWLNGGDPRQQIAQTVHLATATHDAPNVQALHALVDAQNQTIASIVKDR